jgi:hypothetical protein
MPSSTSSSEAIARADTASVRSRASDRSIWVILAGICLIGVTFEAIAVFGLHRMSRIEHRIDEEYRDVLALPAYSSANTPTMLLLGNSLLLEGVDLDSLRTSVAGKYDVHRLVIEQTEYLDLYYVLRKLFRSGSRPHDVVLCLSVPHLIADDNRGEFMARYMDTVDVAALSRRKGMDATTTSNYFFAHWSDWYANRAEIRKFVLGAILPDARDLATVLGYRPAPKIPIAEIEAKSAPRLLELKELCDQYGSRLTILVPPSLREDNVESLVKVGDKLGVRVLVPEPTSEANRSMFRDGVHLNPAGAQIFTTKLGSEL